MPLDIMKALPVPNEEKIKFSEQVIAFASKLFMDFLFYNFDEEHNRFNTSNVKPVIDLCDIIIGKLYGFSKEEINFVLNYEEVIRGGKRISDTFFTLVDYALFERNSKQEYTLALVNALIYGLYIKEKFAEDGLYSEPKEYLLQAVSKHLKPINYDRWAKVYWKRQLEGDLTKKEEEELTELERENMKIIKEVYEKLMQDKEIQRLIEKIRNHEWVKGIEGER